MTSVTSAGHSRPADDRQTTARNPDQDSARRDNRANVECTPQRRASNGRPRRPAFRSLAFASPSEPLIVRYPVNHQWVANEIVYGLCVLRAMSKHETPRVPTVLDAVLETLVAAQRPDRQAAALRRNPGHVATAWVPIGTDSPVVCHNHSRETHHSCSVRTATARIDRRRNAVCDSTAEPAISKTCRSRSVSRVRLTFSHSTGSNARPETRCRTIAVCRVPAFDHRNPTPSGPTSPDYPFHACTTP